ncbi:unnamed protein product [Cylindrotheca closterium]|uniref:Uncharacterized protein n=1 Tax=Cylindrotheca closterium TaxID=2856 RepID=A0AAD2JL83_9STRA|nr:unnamed protein product [Cylindrotheca closterium]
MLTNQPEAVTKQQPILSIMTHSNNLKQLSSTRRPMSLDAALKTMPSPDFLPRALPRDDSPEGRRDFLVGILDEVLDILNEDIFDDDLDTKSDHGLPQ